MISRAPSIALGLNPALPYKTDTDFTPIAHMANATNLLLAPQSLPVSSVREFIPYRGTALAIPDLVSNKIQLLFDNVVSGMPHVKDGKLKALAISSLKRSPLAPDLPTMDESGLPGFESVTWFGIYGPRGLSPELVARLNADFNQAMQSAEVQERLAKLGAEPVTGGSPQQFAATVKADAARWARLIKDRKITLE